MTTATNVTNQTAQTPRAARDVILDALEDFVNQRPRMDPRDYIRSWDDKDGQKAYANDRNATSRAREDARALLAAVRRSSVSEAQLIEAFRAFSGRLSWDGQRLDYCVGSYWPMEYRHAVCAVLSSALWAFYREDCCCETSDKIRAAARRNLPRTLVARWFN